MFDQLASWFSGASQYAADTWQGAVDKLKNTAREFAALLSWLENRAGIAASNPQLQADYTRTVSRGQAIRATVEKATGGIDWINGQLKSITGSGLNALPAIPVALTVATILGLVSLMGYWLADAYKLKARMEYAEQHGITGQAALDFIQGTNVKQILLIGAAIAGAIYMGRGFDHE